MRKNFGSSPPPKPPRLAERIFRFLFPDSEIFTTLGDLEEIFRNLALERNIRQARLWYWLQLFKALPHRISGFFFMDIPMFVLSLKIMVRSLRKNKIFSFLNIFALTLGLFCFLMIFVYARYEFTYDSFHPGYRNIYKIILQGSIEDEPPSVHFPLAPVLQSQIPEIDLAARYCYAFDPLIKIDNRLFKSTGKFADENFLKVFYFPIIRAIDRPLSNPNAVILTESSAERFFGSEDPMGKTMSFNIRGEACELTVNGILTDPPRNTHFDFDLLISFSTTEVLPKFKALMETVSYSLTATYIKLNKKSSAKACQEKISRFIRSHSPVADSLAAIGCDLQHITDIHLHPDNKESSAVHSLSLYLTLGLIILIVACINYVNLATARSSIRMREVGIRKTIGAQKSQLVRQFIGEAIILTGISSFLSFALLRFALPVFNRFLNRDIGLHLFFKSSLWLEILGIIVIVGVASGSYPAMFLSSLRPVRIFKGAANSSGTTGFRPSRLRSILVIVQFTVSVVLICVVFFIHKQVRFIKTMDMGFTKKNIIEAWVPGNALAVKNELLRNPGILGVTMVSNAITLSNRQGSGEEFGDHIEYVPDSGSLEEFRAHHMQCDSAFLNVFNIPLLYGRDFSDTMNESSSAIVNETFVQRLGPDNPIGKHVQIQNWWDDENKIKDLIIIGVVKDFHHQPLTQKIKPFILTHTRENFMSLYAKIREDDSIEMMDFIRQTIRDFNPERLLPIGFLEERIDEIYKTEENQRLLLSVFSVMTVLIACMGLLGLAAFTTEQRTKEIGIRKVLGAQSGQLLLMLSRDFGLLVFMANLIGWPLAYYFIGRWMANFAYHVPIIPWTFLLTGILVLLATFFASGAQILRAAHTNPADILRHE